MERSSVVTGGGGFVGRHIVAALHARGDRVRTLDLRAPADLPGEIATVDITDPIAVRDAIAGADVVFHNASAVHTKQDRTDVLWRVNVEGTKNVIDACL